MESDPVVGSPGDVMMSAVKKVPARLTEPALVCVYAILCEVSTCMIAALPDVAARAATTAPESKRIVRMDIPS